MIHKTLASVLTISLCCLSFVTLTLSTPEVRAGDLLKPTPVKEVPGPIKKLFPKAKNTRLSAQSVDIDQDGKPDYIVEIKTVAPESSEITNKLKRCFVDSGFKIRHCAEDYPEGFRYLYFAQLDSDPLLEVFDFKGDEDTSDYALAKLDSKTWALKRLFGISPYLYATDKDHHGLYWGYPWDIQEIELQHEGKETRIPAILPKDRLGQLDEEGEYSPTIFFKGTPTQGSSEEKRPEGMPQEKFYTLQELVAGSRSQGLEKDCAIGFASACYKQGMKLYVKESDPKKLQEVVEYFRKAAKKGYYPASESLASMYKNGEGVPKDPVLYLYWAFQKRLMGPNDKIRKQFGSDLTDEQIMKAKEMLEKDRRSKPPKTSDK